MIKHEAMRAHFSRRSSEIPYAEALGRAFDINHGKRYRDLSFWFAVPKSAVAERFGLGREVVVVFSEHTRTDARVVRCFEEALKEDSWRVEPNLALIVHAGTDADFYNSVSGSPERVFVNLRLGDLLEEARAPYFVQSALANRFGETDLYGMSDPLETDTYFFGRASTVTELTAHASGTSATHGLFGTRKAGKTSVLYAVRRVYSKRGVPCPYIDLQSPGRHAARWWELLHQVRDAAVRASQELGIAAQPSKRPYKIGSAALSFREDISDLLKLVPEIRVLFDEVEWITPSIAGRYGRHWDLDYLPFAQTLRSTSQELSNFSFVLAGVNPRALREPMFAGESNPLFSLAQPMFLKAFSDVDVRSLVESIGRYSGIVFNDAVYRWLEAEMGGHPHLTRLACSAVWQHHRNLSPDSLETLTDADFEKSREEIQKRISQGMLDILLTLMHWYPDDFDILQLMAMDDVVEDGEFYNREYPETVKRLIEWRVLDSNHQFRVPFMRTYLRENAERLKSAIWPFNSTDLPPEVLPIVVNEEGLRSLAGRRITVESALRRLIINVLGLSYRYDNAKVAQAIVTHVPARPGMGRPVDLFLGRPPKEAIQELYIDDLSAIIVGHWDKFSGFFIGGKSKFQDNFALISKARRAETHTRPVTDHELEKWGRAYDWMNAQVENVPD